jgi:hypothetical protein
MAAAVTENPDMRGSGTLPRTALWLLLGGWVGSWVSFGLVVAPAVFRGAPEVAGEVIGPVLKALHLYGGLAGIALAGLAWARHRGALLVALPLLMSAVCFASHFGVSTAIAELGELAFGSGDAEAARRFSELHRVSVGIFVLVGFAGLGLLGLHARADAREASG